MIWIAIFGVTAFALTGVKGWLYVAAIAFLLWLEKTK